MIKTELISRSPLRILENTAHGGVGKGNVGVIASRKGVGKTGCLVHIATDKLFQDQHVIHVSFSENTNHIVSWYEDIFREIAKKKDLEGAMEVHDELVKNRVIMNFNQEGVTSDQVLRSLRAMIVDGHFTAECIVVDGFDFLKAKPESFDKIRGFASELGVEIWFSATVPVGEEGLVDSRDVPRFLEPFLDKITVLVSLKPAADCIQLVLVKDHDSFPHEDTHLKLDPKTLLIAEETA